MKKEKTDKEECPYCYYDICELNRKLSCCCKSDYKNCEVYKEYKAFEEITDDGTY